MSLGLCALFRAFFGWTRSLQVASMAAESSEEHSGGVICEQLAEAFVEGGHVDYDVSFCHFDHGLCCWRAIGIGNDCFYDFVKCYM